MPSNEQYIRGFSQYENYCPFTLSSFLYPLTSATIFTSNNQPNKTHAMETSAIQQEILLIKNSSFCRRHFFDKETFEIIRHLPYDEQLEVACWNGWLTDMLPEVLKTSISGKRLYIWEIMQAKAFMNIALCESPQTIDVQSSINPYAFLITVCYV